MTDNTETLGDFLANWPESPKGNRAGFLRLRAQLAAEPGIELSFHPRPGLTYSLRASNPQAKRPLVAMIDVIEDEPRWLSVCFYEDLVHDPAEQGDAVPGGLLGEDARCFDLESCTEEALCYVEERIDEALRASRNP